MHENMTNNLNFRFIISVVLISYDLDYLSHRDTEKLIRESYNRGNVITEVFSI